MRHGQGQSQAQYTCVNSNVMFGFLMNRLKLPPKSNKMKFTGFMDGSKSIRYYNAATRSIKVSRNFSVNGNDDLNELEIYTDLPDLVDVEGEDTLSDDPPNPTVPNTETPETRSLPPVTRPVREGRKDLDYRTINNPHAQPSRSTASHN